MSPERKLHRANELDVAIHPGETLRELMEERGLTVDGLSQECGLSQDFIEGILAGAERVDDPSVAWRLESCLGTPARLWKRLQAAYDRAQDRRGGQ